MPRVESFTRPHGRPPRVRNLLAFSGCIMLLFGIIVLYQAFREYDDAIDRGRKDAERLSTILADQMRLTFSTVDLSLERIVERQHLNELFGGTLPQDMVASMNRWIEEIPQMAAILIVGENGDVSMAVHDKAYDGWLDYRRNLRESPAFQSLSRDGADEFYLGPFSGNSPLHSDLVLVARRIDRIDGRFGGIVVAAVRSGYFVDFFNQVDAGGGRTLSVMLKNGTDLLAGVRSPRVLGAREHDLLSPGRVLPEGRSVSELKKSGGRLRIVAQRATSGFPLVVSVVVGEREFLRSFWQDRLKDALFLGLFMLFGSVLSFFALTTARQIVQIENSEAQAILASQAKSEFLANMSHELRTPLNAIIGFSEMMNSGYFGPLNAKQKERMHDIHLCGNHLLHLISDILEFSKGEAGKLEVVEEKVDVHGIIDETIRMMNEKVKGKAIELLVDVPTQMPKLFADKRKLKQILINLISNAVKFTPPRGEIRVLAKREPGGALAITVIDTGIGIAEEDLPLALSVFGQVHRSHSHEGTGLGLPLCRMFAELHGGKLALSSVIGEGTTVKVTFPASRVVVE